MATFYDSVNVRGHDLVCYSRILIIPYVKVCQEYAAKIETVRFIDDFPVFSIYFK